MDNYFLLLKKIIIFVLMDLKLFSEAYKMYLASKTTSDEMWVEYYDVLFVELSKVKPDDLIVDHVEFMKISEIFFSSKEDFEKADILSKLQDAAENIFKAREVVEELKRRYGK